MSASALDLLAAFALGAALGAAGSALGWLLALGLDRLSR